MTKRVIVICGSRQAGSVGRQIDGMSFFARIRDGKFLIEEDWTARRHRHVVNRSGRAEKTSSSPSLNPKRVSMPNLHFPASRKLPGGCITEESLFRFKDMLEDMETIWPDDLFARYGLNAAAIRNRQTRIASVKCIPGELHLITFRAC